MASQAGQTMLHYRLVEKIGEGGMGVVWKAVDEDLNREAAIKILPEVFARDPDRLARFEREARLLASLNHRNIAAIFGVHESGSTRFLAMEFVAGEDLSQRLLRGRLPVAEALSIAGQVAEALEAAHARGVIHRDLKPANIRITADFDVKVLDFGLAKSTEPQALTETEIGDSPTVVSPTVPGIVMGTAGYMSPEQARGRPVDRRTDVFSFGCVLYEMLTGLKLFAGATVSDSIGATLHKEPDWERLPHDLPPTIHLLLRRCLARPRKQRLQDIGDARLEIEDVDRVDGPSALVFATDDRGTRSFRQRIGRVLVLVLAALAPLSLLVAGWSLYSPRADRTVTRLTISLPIGSEITSAPAVSPDGRLVAYTARDDASQSGLYVRALDEYVPRLVVGTGDPFNPFFSPDGRQIGFFDDDLLWRVDVGGGTPTALAAAPIPFGGTWGPGDDIVFAPSLNSGLYTINASGGEAERITVPDGDSTSYAHVWPEYAASGESLIFTILGSGQKRTARLAVESRQWEEISVGGSDARMVGSTHLLQSDQDGGLWAVPLRSGTAAGSEPISAVAGSVHYLYASSRAWYDVSPGGSLIYVPTSGFKHRLTWITRESGAAQTVMEEEMAEIALSPDGENVLYTLRGGLWVYDLVRNTRTRVEAQPTVFTPEWAPDGERIYFSANRTGDWDLYTKIVTDTSPATRVLERPHAQHVSGIAADGTMAFWDTPPESNTRVWVRLPGEEPRIFLDSDTGAARARFSPRGDLLAYTVAAAQQSGADVFLVSYPEGTQRVQVSRDGGQEPVWSPDGETLFYRKGDVIMSVSVAVGDELRVGSPRVELGDLSIARTWANYRLSPDGARFLVLQRDPGAVPRQINVVLNWRAELDEQ